jgi:hypothetical protein
MGLEIYTPPVALPVSLAEFRAHVIEALNSTDALLTQTLTEAIEWVQFRTQRQFIPATWIQTWDRFPHWGNRHGVHDSGGPNFYFGQGMSGRRMPLKIDLRPLLSVISVTYYDATGTLQTLSPETDYWVDMFSRPPRIAAQQCWPFTQLHRPASVQVMFTAGYADGNATVWKGSGAPPDGLPAGSTPLNGDYYIDTSASPPNYYGPMTGAGWGSILGATPQIRVVPNTAKLAIKQLAAFWFEQREAVVITESAEPTATYPAIGDIPFGVESLCQQLDAEGYT